MSVVGEPKQGSAHLEFCGSTLMCWCGGHCRSGRSDHENGEGASLVRLLLLIYPSLTQFSPLERQGEGGLSFYH